MAPVWDRRTVVGPCARLAQPAPTPTVYLDGPFPNTPRAMTLTRREFAAMLAGAVGGVTIPLLLRSPDSPPDVSASEDPTRRRADYFDWRRVGPRVQVALLGGGNSLLFMGGQKALLSDAKSFGLGRTLAREAREFGVPIDCLVATHHHGDHSGGAEAFRDLPRLAHVNAAPRILETARANLERADTSLAALRGRLTDSGAPPEMTEELEGMVLELATLAPEDFGPTETFEDIHEIDIDGHPVLVRWVSRGHTDGDAFLHLPEENVLHCGDLLFHERHPYIDVSSAATPEGWLRCLEAMLALCDEDTVVVPGHGDITDRRGLETQRDYFVQLRTLVEDGLAEGRSREEIAMLETPALRSLNGAEQYLGRNLGIVYDEMAG